MTNGENLKFVSQSKRKWHLSEVLTFFLCKTLRTPLSSKFYPLSLRKQTGLGTKLGLALKCLTYTGVLKFLPCK